ncbi:MAG TPA: bifunctional UDP-N-acetylmuramoyl-tripeptide:D-alanyl-D-alanine ligase/alanine racemase [Candidatus Avirikenella pullistercoris]|nr:bifunctional UDP-N-acetylmuramoyl-tripeptide:D-alanyl-D-alanine ligase/alanine racemase [Candidatus Avirikenella pullistercoris]
MEYNITLLAEITGGKVIGAERSVRYFMYDSRNVFDKEDVMFVAIRGTAHDGHHYIGELIARGVHLFMVEPDFEPVSLEKASYLVVPDTLAGLQRIAAYHRQCYAGTVLGITGSNGKTVVKEWISQLWEREKALFRSPKSYNSQLGVALSLAMLNDEPLAVVEAGISRKGEMERLERMIKPDIVLLTNIGEAHSENFSSWKEKLDEKLELAADASVIIYCNDDERIRNAVTERFPGRRLIGWGMNEFSPLRVVSRKVGAVSGQEIEFSYKERTFKVELPFGDDASYENVMSALAFYACFDETDLARVVERCSRLEPVAMRLELKAGISGSRIVNDSYNSDLNSLSIALDYLSSVGKDCSRRIVVLSDIYQSGYEKGVLYGKVAELIKGKKVDYLVGIGPDIIENREVFKGIETAFYMTTDDFIRYADRKYFAHAAILLKGSRRFSFERISRVFEEKIHTTVMEVDLDAMVYNLNYYRGLLQSGVRMTAMVKASSYGSGSVDVARALEQQHIDNLAVAYTDEGVVLREGGITTPIIVLNSEPGGYASMIEHRLEPEIYDFASLESFCKEVRRAGESAYPIHIKLDTGMHRLGFGEFELEELIFRLKGNNDIRVRSVFSHLTSSDNPAHDSFTLGQIEAFDRISSRICEALKPYKIIRHICNSSAIERFPQAQFDMVRLGIGLYGISPLGRHNLHVVNTLKSVIVQVKRHTRGESVGYNRQQVLDHDAVIATVPIGYADGLRRKLSCGNWSMRVNGKMAPIVGNICMDACMIDITGIDAGVGDSVVVFGNVPSIEDMAEKLETIPYEILTGISSRVKRVYIKE